tara:strand:- start:1765 stop:2766 length:1002 start_codon:yes stop_codon:yes gene_type:complete
MKTEYKKVPNNDNAIEIDGKVILSFDPRYKEYLKWKEKNPDLEQELIKDSEREVENKRLYNNGAPHEVLDETGYRQGKCVFYYENGNKKWEGTYKDGILNGELKQYEKSGDILSIENFEEGALQGKFEYFQKGKLRETGNMLSNRKHGEVRAYWVNKKLKRIENFKNGVANGEFKEFYVNGKLLSTGQTESGLPIGVWRWYHQNSQLKREVVYVDGSRAKSIEWNFSGCKILEQEWTGNIWHGRCRWWSADGILVKDYNYRLGKLHGKFIDYYSTGVKRASGIMKYGTMDGKWTFYYHGGEKELECKFDFGNLIGSAKLYHDNGILKQKVDVE